MPNWCNNSISIQGSTETIKALWEDATADDGTGENRERGLLDAMVPMPRELEGTTAPSDSPNWYDWCVGNWGTKWDVSTEGLEFIDNGDGTASIQGWFDSAWAPPIAAYEKFCEDMDGVYLEASYHEGGMDFAGFWDSETGDEYMDDLYGTWKANRDNLEDAPALFQRIDEEYNISENFEEWEEDEVEG